MRNGERWALLAFPAIFGDVAPQISPSASVESARLDLILANGNCEASIADIVVAWTDSVTYNTFGLTAGAQMNEDFSTPFAVLPTVTPGKISVDVTTSVKAWQTAPLSNNGWLLVATGGLADCTIRSSDENQLQLRPLLSVTYVP
jgi:hypothetical protein